MRYDEHPRTCFHSSFLPTIILPPSPHSNATHRISWLCVPCVTEEHLSLSSHSSASPPEINYHSSTRPPIQYSSVPCALLVPVPLPRGMLFNWVVIVCVERRADGVLGLELLRGHTVPEKCGKREPFLNPPVACCSFSPTRRRRRRRMGDKT